MKTIEELKAEYLIYSMQSQKMKLKINELQQIKDVSDKKAELIFKVIEDHYKQLGTDIPEMPIDMEP